MQIANSRFEGRAILDIASYARRGPGRRDRPAGAELKLIERTVSRTPEVMIKVSGGGSTVKGVAAHFSYIDRKGDLEIETDDGEHLKGKGVEKDLLDDWNLADELAESTIGYSGKSGRKPSKLVHNIILSMPAGTPPERLYAASKDFAREQFALKNRYAMVLHTDQEHPHVHLVVKAAGEDGQRLNIRKANLREWRSEFARHLREHGVPANATERAVRDQDKVSKPDGLYRVERRGDSWKQRARDNEVNTTNVRGEKPAMPPPGISEPTRRAVSAGWQVVLRMLKEISREQEADRNREFESTVSVQRDKLPLTPSPDQDGYSR